MKKSTRAVSVKEHLTHKIVRQIYTVVMFVSGMTAIVYLGVVQQEYAAIGTALLFVPLSMISAHSLEHRSFLEILVLCGQLVVSLGLILMAGGRVVDNVVLLGIYPLLIQTGALLLYAVAGGYFLFIGSKVPLRQRLLAVLVYVGCVTFLLYWMFKPLVQFGSTAIRFYLDVHQVTTISFTEIMVLAFTVYAIYTTSKGLKELS